MQIKDFQDINQNENQTKYTNRDISEKKQLFIGNLHSNATGEDIDKLFGLRSTQFLKQNCLVNMSVINEMGKDKRIAFIVTLEKVH